MHSENNTLIRFDYWFLTNSVLFPSVGTISLGLGRGRKKHGCSLRWWSHILAIPLTYFLCIFSWIRSRHDDPSLYKGITLKWIWMKRQKLTVRWVQMVPPKLSYIPTAWLYWGKNSQFTIKMTKEVDTVIHKHIWRLSEHEGLGSPVSIGSDYRTVIIQCSCDWPEGLTVQPVKSWLGSTFSLPFLTLKVWPLGICMLDWSWKS